MAFLTGNINNTSLFFAVHRIPIGGGGLTAPTGWGRVRGDEGDRGAAWCDSTPAREGGGERGDPLGPLLGRAGFWEQAPGRVGFLLSALDGRLFEGGRRTGVENGSYVPFLGPPGLAAKLVAPGFFSLCLGDASAPGRSIYLVPPASLILGVLLFFLFFRGYTGSSTRATKFLQIPCGQTPININYIVVRAGIAGAPLGLGPD